MSANKLEPARLLSIVLATRNEEQSIGHVMQEISEASRLLCEEFSISVVMVDDSSADNTVGLAHETARNLGLDLDVIEGPGRGLGQAILAGLARALEQGPSLIVTLDADGQHDARDIPKFVNRLLQDDSDLVVGCRFGEGSIIGMPAYRRLISRIGNLVLRVTCRTGVLDATTSFRAFRPRVIETFDPPALDLSGYNFFSAFVVAARRDGFRISEQPIIFRPRLGGESKLGFSQCVSFGRALPALARYRRSVPVVGSTSNPAQRSLDTADCQLGAPRRDLWDAQIER